MANKVVPRSIPPLCGQMLRVFYRERGDIMSGEHRRFGGFMLPAIVVIAGVVYALGAAQNGMLSAARLKPVNWAGLALMAAGVAATFIKKPAAKLIGVLACGLGAILVICL